MQAHTKCQQQNTPLYDVSGNFLFRISFLPASGIRKRHSNTNDKHEKRLNQIPKSQPVPRMMMKLPEEIFEKCSGNRFFHQNTPQCCTFSNQQKHGNSTEK